MLKKSKLFILASLLPVAAVASADNTSPKFGLSIGGFGLGVNAYGKTPWHLNEQDQLQWNVTVEGISANDEDDVELNKNDYRDANIDSIGTRAGINWYPFFGNRFSNNVFFASGFMYSKVDIEAKADLAKNFKVDGKKVKKGDIDSLSLDLSSKTVSPYISLGWGGRISDYQGFVFKAELGASMLKSDSDVKLTAKDPANFLTAQNIKNEKKNIEDDWNEITGFVSVTLSYAF